MIADPAQLILNETSISCCWNRHSIDISINVALARLLASDREARHKFPGAPHAVQLAVTMPPR